VTTSTLQPRSKAHRESHIKTTISHWDSITLATSEALTALFFHYHFTRLVISKVTGNWTAGNNPLLAESSTVWPQRSFPTSAFDYCIRFW